MKRTEKRFKTAALTLAALLWLLPLGAQAQTVRGDFDYDGLLTIKDVTTMLNMIESSAPFTQDDDLDGNGRLDEADVEIELNALSLY